MRSMCRPSSRLPIVTLPEARTSASRCIRSSTSLGSRIFRCCCTWPSRPSSADSSSRSGPWHWRTRTSRSSRTAGFKSGLAREFDQPLDLSEGRPSPSRAPAGGLDRSATAAPSSRSISSHSGANQSGRGTPVPVHPHRLLNAKGRERIGCGRAQSDAARRRSSTKLTHWGGGKSRARRRATTASRSHASGT